MGSNKASKKTLEAMLFEALSQLFQSLKDAEIELQNVSIEADEIDLEPIVRAIMAQIPAPRAVEKPAIKRFPEKLLEAEFTPPTSEYPGRVVEVKIGATKSEGGTRGKSIICLLYTSDAADE